MSFAASATVDSLSDIGTLWTMRRAAQVARCALMASPGEWELRVIVDGVARQTERCQRGSEAFAVADDWKRRMGDEGWRQIVPRRVCWEQSESSECPATPIPTPDNASSNGDRRRSTRASR